MPKKTQIIYKINKNGNLLPTYQTSIITNTVITLKQIRKTYGNKAHEHQKISKKWKRLK